MKQSSLSFDDIFAVMAKASVGDATARVLVADDAQPDDVPTRFALALNILLDDLTFRTDALRRSEEELLATLNSIGDGVIATDTFGKVIRMNPVAEQLTGLRATNAVGRRTADVFRVIDEGTRYVVESPIDRVLRDGVIANGAASNMLVSADGTERVIRDSTSPIRDAHGVIRGVVIVFRDRTEEREAELAIRRSLMANEAAAIAVQHLREIQASERILARAKDAAEAANRELEAFSYSVAHDLRAPLRGMNGFAHLLLDTYGAQLDAEGKDWLRRIMLDAKKMAALIDGLLSLAKVTQNELRPELVDLSGIARNVVAELKASQSDRHVEVIVHEDLHAYVDARLARALIENLLDNAWKFTEGASSPRIEIGTINTAGGAPATFFVRDNGAGFDIAYASKLFTPFQRLHAVAEFPGTGIGLATVQRIVHRSGGRIWAEGAVNEGATFYFTIPTPTPIGL